MTEKVLRYDEDGYPIAGGLADQHLGVIDPGLRCKSCGGRMKDCPGHSGHIELVRPVVHAGFAKAIYQLLKACCRKCGRLMHPAESLSKIKKAAECPHCGEKQRPVKFIKPTSLYEEDRKLLPNEIRERLERIPDEDIDALNLKIRPEWLVLTVLIVPPVTVRPSITLETGERSEDDLTHKLVDIIRINQRLEENVEAGAPQLIIEDLWELLQYHVSTYFDNEIAGIPPARHRSGRQLRTLFQRLKGKEGRFRYNLSGKRVNFSARTVISPDPTLGINQLGVPEDIAAELTVPVAVTAWNLENLREVIRMQPEKINYVIRPDGKRKKITATNLNEVVEELSPGYVIERKLMDDDIVIFNRQPSLHRVSMMCHHVKVLPGKTFRFNVADCRPYNADFDGDEMNIHVPQNEEAQSEAEMLMKVDGQTISPRNGEPIITPDLDQITGLYILTLPEVEFDRADACWLLQSAGIENVEITKDMSGKEIFSTLLPDELDAFIHAKRCKYRKTKEECDNPNCVKIKKGRLVRGSVDARISDALVKLISKEYGTDKGRDYIDAVTRLTVQLATRYGLSLSLDDYYLPKEAKKDIIELYKEGRKKVRALISQYKTKKLKRLPGKTLKETLEEQVMEILENIRHECWQTVRKNIKSSPIRIGKTIIEHNPAILMAQAGVKNKPINVVQMSALVGQQAVRGKRMTSGYRRRILPHYRVGDLNDDARGFVRSNYKQGLTAAEYFFHAAGGRDSVVDKGVNPAKTGYMQRRLINALQDLIVAKDMSVRDSYGRVVQFTYGEDGKDPMTGDQVVYGDPVGVIAAQSLGEPGTQMSIAADEKVLVEKDGQIQPVAIGEFIDQIMQEHGWEKLNGTDVLNMDGSFGIRVPALTGHGKVEWKDVRQCSRHRCEKHMLEITTRSGRKIRATDNHSFVIRKQGQLVPISGSLLETGQRIPVLKHLPARANDLLEMESILSKQTHWFGSELQKAVAHSPISRTHHNLEYTVPVGADALRHYAGGHQSFDIEDGFVYPMQNHSTAHIPEKMPLDSEFGWLLGAYLSEGSLTRHGIEISNTDDGFLSPVRSFAQRLGVNFHEKDNLRGFAKGHDLTLHSSLLSEFLEKTCGKGSGHKKVPGFAFSAPNEFAS
ncbi:DNA-directed RNA polymerase subunit A', partial [Candidatus Micrarchaeota archaeon]|nr:DNA-directed RNA polymerase subunit A' [Candidatus Micrarchaeota archaeon]